MYKACALFLSAALLASAEPRLQIVVVEGQNAINNTKTHIGREPVIEVRDDKDAPVPGAVVTFQAPAEGPSVGFGNGESTFLTQTDESGRAIARGLKPNSSAGAFQIRVTVSAGGETASAVIDQTNAMPTEAKSNNKKILLIVLLGGAAAGGAAFAAMGGKSSSSTTNTTSGSITAGSPSFGPPH